MCRNGWPFGLAAAERRREKLPGTDSAGPRVPAPLGIRTVATGVVLQLVRVLRVGTLKPPSSGTRAKGWSHLEAPGELGAAGGDRERVAGGWPWKPHPCQGPPACPWPRSLTHLGSTHLFPLSHFKSRLPVPPLPPPLWPRPFQRAKSSLWSWPLVPETLGASVHLTLRPSVL